MQGLLNPNVLLDVKRLQRELYTIVQGRGGGVFPDVTPAPFTHDVQNNSPTTDAGLVAAPTGVTASVVTFYDQMFIEVNYTASVTSGVDEYEIKFTKVGVGAIGSVRTGGTHARSNVPIDPNSSYQVEVRAIKNSIARSSAYTAPITVNTGPDAKIPAQVQGVTLSTGIRSIGLRWISNSEHDVANGQGLYEIEIDTVNTFSSGALRRVRVPDNMHFFSDLVTGTTYYLRVRAIDSSGNEGAWSTIVSGTTSQATGADIQANSIVANHIVAGEIETYHMDAASINADRLMVNTLNANRMTTSSLDAAIITITSGGMLRMGRTSAPFHYMLINEDGIRFYKTGSAAYTGGVLSFEAAVATGNILVDGGTINASTIIGGIVKTAVSGNRVEMNAASVDSVSWYTGDGSEYSPGISRGFVQGAGGTRYLNLQIDSPEFSADHFANLNLYSRSADTTIPVEADLRAWLAGTAYGRLAITTNRIDMISGDGADKSRLTLNRGNVGARTAQLIYGNAATEPNVSLFNNNGSLRFGDSTGPGVFVYSGSSELRGVGNDSGGAGFYAFPASVYMQRNNLDYIKVFTGVIDYVLGTELFASMHNDGTIGTEFWRTIAMNGWRIRLTDRASTKNYVVYNTSITGPEIQGDSQVWIRAQGGDCSVFLTGGVVDILTYTGAAYQNIRALNFLPPPSEAKFKTDIELLQRDFVNVISKAKVYRFRRVDDPAKMTIGTMIEDLPEDMKYPMKVAMTGEESYSWSITDKIMHLWGAIDQIAHKLNEIIEALPPKQNRPDLMEVA